MTKKINPKSLANLNPSNRYQGKQRFNTTLLPETISWLQEGGNASQKIEELVQQAKSDRAHQMVNSINAHELTFPVNAHDQILRLDSHDTHELKAVEDMLYQAEEKLNAVDSVVGRWESEVGYHKASSPRWEKVIKLLAELRTVLQDCD